MKLLLVEDLDDNIKLFRDTIDRYSRQHNIAITYEIAKSASEASKTLNHSFDGAIIDLKLEQDEDGGNKVVREIQEAYRIPIAVHTGTPTNLSINPSPLLFLNERDSGYDPVFDYLYEIFNTGLTQILGGRGVFEKSLTRLFWNHIPEAIQHFIECAEASESKQIQLLRYSLSHLTEILEEPQNVHSNTAETYIYPPIKELVVEGGIVNEKTTDNIYIVLTPACDIANQKADFIQMVSVSAITVELENVGFPLSEQNRSRSRSDKLEGKISSFVENKNSRYHYLPKFGAIQKDSIADFQNIKSVPLVVFNEEYELKGSIAGIFYKDLVSRFSSNYARQGSPDYDFIKERQKVLSVYTAD